MIQPPEEPRELIFHIHPHQRVLSFQGDDDALRFDSWWGEVGLELFLRNVNEE